MAICKQLLSCSPVFIAELALKIRAFVPVYPQPFQTLHDTGNGCFTGALGIGVLDAQDQRSAMLFGKEPVKKRGAGAADMQIAGGTGRETNTNWLCHVISIQVLGKQTD
jgi:hypothetical protein